MQQFKVLVFDDEPPAREELVHILSSFPNIKVIKSGENGYQAVHYAKTYDVDVIFLDIQMPGINGLAAAKQILDSKPHVKIIFVTAYDEFAVKAFEISAFDYILKPFDHERLSKTINRLKLDTADNLLEERLTKLLKQLNGNREDKIQKIPCEKRGRIVLVDPSEIIYCSAEEGHVFVKTSGEKLLCHFTLGELEEKLGFFRTHRSYIVNLDKIEELSQWFHGTYKLIMSGSREEEIPVSRGQAKKLKTILGI